MRDHGLLFAATLVCLASLAGCGLAQKQVVAPAPWVEGSFRHGPVPAAAATLATHPEAERSLQAFWRRFGDPVLDELVAIALASNDDVRLAQARLQEVRSALRVTEAGAWPTVGADSTTQRSLAPASLAPGSRSDRTSDTASLSLVLNWELDLFGRQRALRDSAVAQVSVQQLSQVSVQLAVGAEVATQYLLMRGLQQRQQVAKQAVVSQRETLRLTEARLAAGRATQLDVSRARALVSGTEASLSVLQLATDRAQHRLATLTAQPVSSLVSRVETPWVVPKLPLTDLSLLPISTPREWLRRRADIQAAEQQLASANAQTAVSVAELFPRISLNGLIGLNARGLGRLDESGTGVYSAGASLATTLLDFGRLRAQIAGAEQRAVQAGIVYEQTVRLAVEETENALSGFTRSADQARALLAAAQASEEAASLARSRFAAGSNDLLTVLDAERQALSARDQLLQAESAMATSLITVVRALGGGWSIDAS